MEYSFKMSDFRLSERKKNKKLLGENIHLRFIRVVKSCRNERSAEICRHLQFIAFITVF